ncbi:hemerythrin domain-containing protein [Nonomuraea rhodomycinica]|uniref:Hemerythrin domain-containing protein n=1 Tax=Nonomuraea rhodomycinica TaxID=1712872 RepID=A0A7Y6ITI0_9ACTN|nr:hemerythrin domain-containing protein [Nonomuraea rhodomycinica]NUW44114.1 hemerythrin domain-containing protein [Nonomuraea rhodomycinica]
MHIHHEAATTELDEAARPHAPRTDPAELTPEERRLGQHLAAVHDGYRHEMRQVVTAVEQVAAGTLDPEALRSQINRLTMRQNHWTLGAFCASFCRLVTIHHTIEDENLFPAIAERDPALAPVVAKLTQEHEVIAGLLTALDEACVRLVAGSAEVDEVRARAVRLAEVLSSHFAYEEEELAGPIGRLRIQI